MKIEAPKRSVQNLKFLAFRSIGKYSIQIFKKVVGQILEIPENSRVVRGV